MSHYLNIMRKYANIRAFHPETGAGSGGDGDKGAADDATDAADAPETAEAARVAAEAEAGKKNKGTQNAVLTLEELQAQLDAEKAEKAELLRESMSRKEKLKAFDGIDPEKYRSMVEKERADELASAEAKGEFDRVKAMMAEAHTTETTGLKDRIAELESQLNAKSGAIDELSIGNAFGNSTYIKDKIVLTPTKTRVLYGSHFEAKDGKIVAFDKPKGAADRTQLVNSSGQPLGFDEALEKIVDADPEKKTVLRWKARSGSGSGTDTDKDQAQDRAKPKEEELHGVSRIALSLRNEFK